MPLVLKWIAVASLFGLLLPVVSLAADHRGIRNGVSTGSIYLPVITSNYNPATVCATNPWLINPPDGSRPTSARPTFNWNFGGNPAARIGRYEFSKTAGFEGPLYYWGQYEYPEGTTDGPVYSQPLRSFQFGTTYFWRARVQCDDGNWLSSPVWSFTPSSGVSLEG